MATTETYAPNRLYTIPLAELMPDPNQPRKYFDPTALSELTASVAKNGVMPPIFFRVENGLKYIVALNNLKQAIEDTLAAATEDKASKNLA